MIVNLIIKIAMTVALMTTLIFGTSKFSEEYKVYQDNKVIENMSSLATLKSETELKEYKILMLKDNILLVEMNEDKTFTTHKEYKTKSRKIKKTEKNLDNYSVIKTFSPKKEGV